MQTSDKKQLRKELLDQRRRLSLGQAEKKSRQVFAKLIQSGLLEDKNTVALYAAADREVRTRPVFELLKKRGVAAVLPRVRGKGPEIDFYEVNDWDRLERSRLGIPEPSGRGPRASIDQFDLILIPGVGFDRSGARLGYGMGCYDRVLSLVRPDCPRVGLGYDFQLLEKIPVEKHDVPLTAVVTESMVLFPRRERETININRKGGKRSA